MQISLNLFLFILLLLASITANAQIRVRVQFAEIPNLTYQLDCLGDLPIHCSRGNLNKLWETEFLKTEQDRQMLKEWAQLRSSYNKQVKLSERSGENAYLSLFEKIRIAGFQANSAADYTARLDLLTNPPDRRRFEQVVGHFHPKFQIWWQREAAKNGAEFAKQTEALLNSPKIARQIQQFYRFYAPDLPAGYEISFNLFFIPDLLKEPSSGQQLQNYSLMEFKPKEKPEERIDVVVHELCHFFYDNMKSEDKAKLAQNFYSIKSAAAIPSFNLLNETLATAFGNGMIARTVTTKEKYERYAAAKLSFYNNDAIDRAAKASLLWLERWLENQKTITDADFVKQYIANLEPTFGEDLIKPKLYLNEMFLFVDGDFKSDGALRRASRKNLEPVSVYAAEGTLSEENLVAFRNNGRINSVFIVHPNNIKRLAAKKKISEIEANQLEREFNAKGEALFNKERAPFTYVYIVAAKDVAGADKLIEKLGNAKQFFGIKKD